MPRFLIVSVSLILLVGAASGQLIVDATGPIRQRTQEASRGHGGGVGRKLALQVAIQSQGVSLDENGRTEIEFILTNSGENDLTLPVSPNPGDLEPSNPNVGYTVMTLALRVSSSNKPGAIFSGGADLYGSPAFPGTTTTLAPRSYLRVLARVALPARPEAGRRAAPFIATAMLGNETIRMVDGKIVSGLQEIGFATSQQYTHDSLRRPHD